MTANAGWSARMCPTSVALSDDSIVLMGGTGSSGSKNDTWMSGDYGATWSLRSSSPGWRARYVHNSVALPDDSIVLLGGYNFGYSWWNDTWRSTDKGATWSLLTMNAGWPGRFSPSTVVMPDGSIVLMGGYGGYLMNDMWQSKDNGTTWERINQTSGWSVRYSHRAVTTHDGNVVLMGGVDYSVPYRDVWRYVPPPVADFTATPVTGTIPLTAHFTDMSTGSPTSWNWSFGDGMYSTDQNPVHTYNTYGSHAVNLTVTNSGGSDSREEPAYIMGTGGTYSVFVEGVGDYHGTADDLIATVPLASNFYSEINAASNADATWTGYAAHYNDSTGSKHWSVSESSAIKADYADFALFAGHGNKTMIAFGTANSQQQLTADDMEFGTYKAKWVTLSACFVLNKSTKNDMKPVFNGLHVLNGYDTEGFPYSIQGTQFAQRMKGAGYQTGTIREAWKYTLKNTINIIDKDKYSGASMWAEPCGEDYLPGFGKFCSAPIKENGNYNISFQEFNFVEDM